MFIHDAVLESLSCGNTQIPAADIVVAKNKLMEKDEQTQKTGLETQFQVSQASMTQVYEVKNGSESSNHLTGA